MVIAFGWKKNKKFKLAGAYMLKQNYTTQRQLSCGSSAIFKIIINPSDTEETKCWLIVIIFADIVYLCSIISMQMVFYAIMYK